jgi:hypothetical protein
MTDNSTNEQLDKLALELLDDPNLIGRIQRILHVNMMSMPDKDIGVVGEATTALYVFLY